MIVEHWIHRLARLAKAEPEKRFDRLFREITRPEFLQHAFEAIKDNKGANTPGADGKTKKNWSEREAQRLSQDLRNGTYSPTPVRRVYIPKKSGKMRPLGIPTFSDRVAQSAVKIVLEALYEPVFMDCSHGFRPGKGCYTALASVYDNPKVRIDWVVEGDIQGCFDNVSHHILIRLLHKRIKDDRFLKLISLFLKAGYFEREQWFPSNEGTPQGGIISPILANIYLHEMDRYVEEEIGANKEVPQTRKEAKERINPDWQATQSRITYIRAQLAGKRGERSAEQKEALRKELAELLVTRKSQPCFLKPIKPRIVYVRYADDFVIILRNMPKAEAERIKERLTKWVWGNLRLVLSPEKTSITHIMEGFVFLGYKFLSKKTTNSSQPSVKMTIPFESENAKLKLIRDICSCQGASEVETIRRINSVLWGWMMYYSCVTAPSRTFSRVLSKVWSIYGAYVSRKHDMHIGKAAKRWMRRCPPSKHNLKGGQKTWMATSIEPSGKKRVEYLICFTPSKRSLNSVAMKARGNVAMTQKQAGNVSRDIRRAVCGESCSHGSEGAGEKRAPISE
jgi:group II intron reverse transcriptase/maturase